MSKHLKTFGVALALALASSASAFADGDGSAGGGDNSMSQWRGESHAYFNGDKAAKPAGKTTIRLERSAAKKPLQGDFYTSPDEPAGARSGDAHSHGALAAAPGSGVGHAFRDDTAA